VIPSIRSLVDNVIIARQFRSITAAPKRVWYDGKKKDEIDAMLTFEG